LASAQNVKKDDDRGSGFEKKVYWGEKKEGKGYLGDDRRGWGGGGYGLIAIAFL
jgi:hypothetical protein